jgi:hypothetical protein
MDKHLALRELCLKTENLTEAKEICLGADNIYCRFKVFSPTVDGCIFCLYLDFVLNFEDEIWLWMISDAWEWKANN